MFQILFQSAAQLDFSPVVHLAASASQIIGQGANQTGLQGSGGFTEIIRKIINFLLYLIGVIAVIMIIVGGLRYVTSGGNSSQVSSAKDTILYAVVGLIVAIAAYAIVNFVITQFR